jgi:hypothetical protein
VGKGGYTGGSRHKIAGNTLTEYHDEMGKVGYS